MLSELPTLYRPAAFLIKAADPGWERDTALALRRAVFCVEQGIFIKDDRDAIDDVAIALVALSSIAGDVDDLVGTVRLHSGADPTRSPDDSGGVFWGSRLAVHPKARGAGQIGTSLIRRAVRTAVTIGATRFFAHVQLQNVAMFEALHWRALDTVILHGRRHALMAADLTHYPPLATLDGIEVIFAKARA